jgi:aerobic-type carbon monoxide dehydrogenase small subunit (CoxS/CutS family)
LAEDGRLNPLQQAFLDHGAAQCGFCISGQLMSSQALLAENPHPTVEEVHEGLAGNLCRCAGYEQITQAVLGAAEAGGR